MTKLTTKQASDWFHTLDTDRQQDILMSIDNESDAMFYETVAQEYKYSIISFLMSRRRGLFMTKDNIEVYEGETYYAIDPKTREIVPSVADAESFESEWESFYSRDKAEVHNQLIK